MINSFLVTLQNSAVQPTNPLSQVGDVYWPSPVAVRTYEGEPAFAEEILFDGRSGGLGRFLVAIQLLWAVQESVCADTITADDPRITYTDEQLRGQFIGQAGWEQQMSRILQDFDKLRPLSFLTGRALHVYRSALSPLDRVAAIITYFGQRDD